MPECGFIYLLLCIFIIYKNENQATLSSSNKDLWAGGTELFKANGKLMMWFFLISDAFTFSAFLIAYGLLDLDIQGTGSLSDFSFLNLTGLYQKSFEAFPFFHGVELPLVFVGLMTFILPLAV